MIIAVRDALVATGMGFDAARAKGDEFYQALWAAEKEGPEAVKRVQASIQAILDAGATATKEAVDRVAAAFEAVETLRQAALSEMSARQESEMEALETRRQAALDSIMAVQEEQLSMLKEAQRRELDEMKARQEAELSALKAARNAQLSVVEAAIQRELEDERIWAQLKIDMKKAGGDKEARRYAAVNRANEAHARLKERDELTSMMDEAEERVRAKYKDELDTINAHWDDVEAVTTERHSETN